MTISEATLEGMVKSAHITAECPYLEERHRQPVRDVANDMQVLAREFVQLTKERDAWRRAAEAVAVVIDFPPVYHVTHGQLERFGDAFREARRCAEREG
jgi:hypothetical protein